MLVPKPIGKTLRQTGGDASAELGADRFGRAALMLTPCDQVFRIQRIRPGKTLDEASVEGP